AQIAALAASDTRRVISTVAIRVGAVLVLAFLVQLLASLYRYNMRLAAYFDSRADLLELAFNADNVLEVAAVRNLASVVAPESIEFNVGKMPAEVGVELVKLLASQRTGQS